MESGRKDRWLLLILLLVACVARISYMSARTAVISNEGALYAIMADDLSAGLAFPHVPIGNRPQLTAGWFYPILISGVTLLTRNSELAARLISMMAGLALIVAEFYLARLLYGRAAGWIAAILTAAFPLLVAFSVTAYTEVFYMGLLMWAVYFSLRTFEQNRGLSWLRAGILFGCAYLTRPESLVFPAVVAMLILASARIQRWELPPAARASAGLILVFVGLAAPSIFLFKTYTGRFLLEGKNKLNYTIGQRVLSGLSPAEAARGIDANLNPVGPQLTPLRYAYYTPYPAKPLDLVRYFTRSARRNQGWVFREVVPSFANGSVLIWMLAGIGLFSTAWDVTRLLREAVLLFGVFFIFVMLLSVHMELFRYSLPLLPFLLLWSSFGIVTISGWAKGTALNVFGGYKSIIRAAEISFAVIPIGLLLVAGTAGLRYVSELKEDLPENQPLKEAGLWLRTHYTSRPMLMSVGDIVPYYARADWMPLPYADSSLALQYVESKNPDVLILSYMDEGATPYASTWLKNGIPDAHAHLIFQTGDDSGHPVRIYRWSTP